MVTTKTALYLSGKNKGQTERVSETQGGAKTLNMLSFLSSLLFEKDSLWYQSSSTYDGITSR